MKQTKPEWAARLSVALEKWCRDNGYMRKTKLGSELHIIGKSWSDISAGSSIIGDVGAYARLYLRTGLAEADPRIIPPRRYYTRGRKVTVEKVRAWSEGEWQKWLRSEEAMVIKTSGKPSISKVAEARAEVAQETLGGAVDAWIGILARQVAQSLNLPLQFREAALAIVPEAVDKVVERLRQNPLESRPQEPTLNAGQLARLLRKALVAGTREGRDEIFRKHAESLRDLLPVLDSSTRSDSNQREMELRASGAFKSRK